MEPNTNEATAPKRLKTGGKKPLVIIGVIVAVLAAAYVALCAYANSLDTFYPNTTINGVDVAGVSRGEGAGGRQDHPEKHGRAFPRGLIPRRYGRVGVG